MSKFACGLVADPPDSRDFMLQDYLSPAPEPILSVFEVSPLSPIRDQKTQPICVGEACSGLKDNQERLQGKDDFLSSPLFIYNESKKRDGLNGGGTYLRIALKVLQDIGTVEESCCPYNGRLNVPYCDGWEEQAAKYKIKGYASVSPDPMEMVKALATFGPCVVGMYTSQSWSRTTNGNISDMTDNRYRRGGHAILFIGYNLHTKRFKFRNSWGDDWGDHGNGTLSFHEYQTQMLTAWSSIDL